MQTFLPYADFAATARALDPRRLGKQRVEAIQVLRALTVPGYGWRRHPAALMWTGYEEALVRYGLEICRRWCDLGHDDTCAGTLLADLDAATGVRSPRDPGEPGRRRGPAALARRSRLPPEPPVGARPQGPAHYRELFPDVPDDLPYVWPASDRAADTRRGAG